ncbi:MAG: DUF1292 domain-containing protein [Solobacterium sp.]|nr:DUF1292 domain-containing protein [Solobacterium sp.]MBR2670317.1 DUF1292 domain-containing protein [Solobacterium sp.]
MEDNTIILVDDNGEEYTMEIVLTFEDEQGNNYVLIRDPKGEDESIYAFTYDEDGNLEAVEDPEILEMCEEVLAAFDEEVDE